MDAKRSKLLKIHEDVLNDIREAVDVLEKKENCAISRAYTALLKAKEQLKRITA